MSPTVSVRPNTDQPRRVGETTGERIDLAVAQKRALRASLCHKADTVAPEIGISAQVLRSAAQDDTDAHLPFRRVPALLQATPDPMPLLQFWCGLVGCVVFRLPAGMDAKPMAECVRQFGDLLDAHAEGVEDLRWERHEVEKLRKETNELIAAALANLAHVDARCEGRS